MAAVANAVFKPASLSWAPKNAASFRIEKAAESDAERRKSAIAPPRGSRFTPSTMRRRRSSTQARHPRAPRRAISPERKTPRRRNAPVARSSVLGNSKTSEAPR
jgi:hypothetical protein